MSDTDWYLLDRAGQRYGPYDRELIERLAAQRELNQGTPVWHPGLARWQRADRVLSLKAAQWGDASQSASVARQASATQVADRVARAVATGPTSTRVATPRDPAPKSTLRPAVILKTAAAIKVTPAALKIPATPMTPPQVARRVCAAVFDALILFTVLRFFGRSISGFEAGSLPRIAPLFFIAWAIIDAAFTVRTGASPGKALMAIRIHAGQGVPLTWPRALFRSGVLPLLLLLLTLRTGFTLVVAVGALVLTARRVRSGFAPWWDDITGARVTYGEFAAARIGLAVAAAVVGLVAALIVST